MPRFLIMPNASRLLYGIFFVLEYGLFFFSLYAGFPRGKRIRSALCSFMIYLLTLGVTTRHHLAFVLLIHAGVALLSAWQLRRETAIQLQYALFLAFAFVICRGTWNAQILDLFFPLAIAHHASLFNECITLAFLLFARRFIIRIEVGRILAWRELLSELFPVCAMFSARVAIYHYCYYLKSQMSPEAALTFSWIGAFLAMAAICSLAANEVLFSYNASKRQLDLAQSQLKRQYDMFTERQRSDEQLKQLHHDMANHLSILRGMKNTDDIRQYIRSIDEAVARTSSEESDTGNETLNLLLYQKGEECRRQGFSLEAAIRFPQTEILAPMEICTLFANCIDNAMEAVSHEQVADKTIRISGHEHHGHWIVRFENAYAHDLQYTENQITSSKMDPLHGYGLQNVRAVLQEHDGTLSIHPDNGRFVLTFMIPVSQLTAENDQLS